MPRRSLLPPVVFLLVSAGHLACSGEDGLAGDPAYCGPGTAFDWVTATCVVGDGDVGTTEVGGHTANDGGELDGGSPDDGGDRDGGNMAIDVRGDGGMPPEAYGHIEFLTEARNVAQLDISADASVVVFVTHDDLHQGGVEDDSADAFVWAGGDVTWISQQESFAGSVALEPRGTFHSQSVSNDGEYVLLMGHDGEIGSATVPSVVRWRSGSIEQPLDPESPHLDGGVGGVALHPLGRRIGIGVAQPEWLAAIDGSFDPIANPFVSGIVDLEVDGSGQAWGPRTTDGLGSVIIDHFVYSGDGQYLLFTAPNSADYGHPRPTGTGFQLYRLDLRGLAVHHITEDVDEFGLQSLGHGGYDISDSGRFMVYENYGLDHDAARGAVFLADADEGWARPITVLEREVVGGSTTGGLLLPQVSGDGEWVLFESDRPEFNGIDTRDRPVLYDIAADRFVPMHYAPDGTPIEQGWSQMRLSRFGAIVFVASYFEGSQLAPRGYDGPPTTGIFRWSQGPS